MLIMAIRLSVWTEMLTFAIKKFISQYQIMKLFKLFLLLVSMTFTWQVAFAQIENKESEIMTPKAQGKPKDAKKLAKAAEKKLAEDAKTIKKAQAKEPTDKDIVYLFGVGFNFNDTVVYMTDIVPVKRIVLLKRTKFLPYRSEFSLQWREYLEGTLGLDNQTTSVFYAKKRKKISKRYYKMKQRCLNDMHSRMVVVGKEQFSFHLPETVNEQE